MVNDVVLELQGHIEWTKLTHTNQFMIQMDKKVKLFDSL